MTYALHHTSYNGKLFSGLDIAKKHRPKSYQGILRCRAGAGGQGKPSGDGKPAGPDRPLEKGVGGIKKERAEHQGLGQSPNEKTRPRL